MSPRLAIVGAGVVARRVEKRLALAHDGRSVVTVDSRLVDLATSRRLDGVDVVVLAQQGPHHPAAVALLDRGIHVVSVGDQVHDVAALLEEGDRADSRDAVLVVGAGMWSGLTGLMARHLAGSFASIDEIHLALHGTAGPACARQHHRALAGTAVAFDDGAFTSMRAGTGRELVWFPEPVGAYDCYRAELPAPMVLHRAFPQVERITARMSANRRDRFTSRLPMLTPPHKEGGVGACRVELRGADASGARMTVIGGIAEMVATAAAATACAYVEATIRGSMRPGLVVPGEESVDTTSILRDIVRFGVRLQEFTGVPNS
ncbi:hypothetical protein [Ilumatobacter sp.]|uniref:hypothetical protein n=3 Tax=Ilumatobacter sp. TaxID=1967498 RepID=UPI0032989400